MLRAERCVVVCGAAVLVSALALSIQGGTAQAADKDVRVVNTTSEPVPTLDLTNPAFQPFRENRNVSLAPGEIFKTSTAITVPAGKRLVVEHVSLIGGLPPGQLLDVSVNIGNTIVHKVLVTEQGVFVPQQVTFGSSSPIRVYVSPGEELTLTALRSEATGEGFATFFLTGHFVDAP